MLVTIILSFTYLGIVAHSIVLWVALVTHGKCPFHSSPKRNLRAKYAKFTGVSTDKSGVLLWVFLGIFVTL